jgi:ParB/RepB/Spo0J family partition protein
MAEKIENIEPSKIEPSPFNPRRALPNMEQLVYSISNGGIIEPLIVRPINQEAGSKFSFEMVNGHRRLAAAEELKLPVVPCIVREMTDEDAKQTQLVTALQREELHPYDEAVLINDLLEKHNGEFEAVGLAIGKKVNYVKRRAVLVSLIAPAAESFKANKIGLDTAFALARTTPETQKACLAEAKNRSGITATLVDWFCRSRFTNLKEAPWDLKDANLIQGVGSCVECPKQSNNQPALFESKEEKNLCLDPVCFKKKLAKFVDGKKKDNPDLVLIRAGTRPYGMDEIAPDKYKPITVADLTCPSTMHALIIDGGYKKSLVCTDPKCKIHSARAQATPQHKKELAEDRMAKQVAKEVYNDILTQVSHHDGVIEHRIIANFMWDGMWNDLKKVHLDYYGLKANFDMAEDIDRINDVKVLQKLIFGFALSGLLLPRTAKGAAAEVERLYPGVVNLEVIRNRITVPAKRDKTKVVKRARKEKK